MIASAALMGAALRRLGILALAGLVPTFASGAHAQPAPAPAPALDPEALEAAKSALELAREVWGRAESLQGGPAANAHAASAGSMALTTEAAAAGVALVQAAGVIGAAVGVIDLHTMRAGSIVRFGNPYGAPARDIAFPIRRHLRKQRPAIPPPFPVPEPPEGDEPREPQPGRVYATYTRYNRSTGRYYAGRTSAIIDLAKDWELQAKAAVKARNGDRDADQEPDPSGREFDNAELDRYAVGRAVNYKERYRDLGYLAIRGREQQLIDHHGARRAKERGIEGFDGGAWSDTEPGEPLTENKIRAVARDNPLGEVFHGASNLYFGQLAPYTGDRRVR